MSGPSASVCLRRFPLVTLTHGVAIVDGGRFDASVTTKRSTYLLTSFTLTAIIERNAGNLVREAPPRATVIYVEWHVPSSPQFTVGWAECKQDGEQGCLEPRPSEKKTNFLVIMPATFLTYRTVLS